MSHRLEIARQYLDDAKLLASNGRWSSAVSRSYYASYRAMWGVLGEPTEERLWRHLAIIKHFVRGYWLQKDSRRDGPGLLEHLRLPLRRLYQARLQGDYDAVSLSKGVAETSIQTVEATIRVIEAGREKKT